MSDVVRLKVVEIVTDYGIHSAVAEVMKSVYNVVWFELKKVMTVNP